MKLYCLAPALAWLFFLFCAPVYGADNTLPAPTKDAFVYFTADQATADPSSKKVDLQGNVTVIQKTEDGKKRTVTGDHLTLDQAKTQISSIGPMKVESADTTLKGNNVVVNYTTKDFKAEDISTQYPPLRVLSAAEISSVAGTETLKDATLTCCNNEDPHYSIWFGKLSVSAEKHLFGTNAVMKVYGVPVMWLPVFWRSLESKKPFTTYVDFTQSNKLGLGIMTSTVFQETLGFHPKLNLDIYSKAGVGIGGELLAITTPKLKGTGEFYYIHDSSDSIEKDVTDKNRWGVRGGYWWEMADTSDQLNKENGALYQFQTQFRMVSDPYFNDSFFRGNPYIFMPDQETNFSFARQSRLSTFRVSYQQRDIYDIGKKQFMAEKRSLPQIKFSLLPFQDPLFKTSSYLEVDFDNTSRLATSPQGNEEGPYRQQAHARWTTEKAFRLTPEVTLTPSVFYDQTLTFKDKYDDKNNSWVSRVGTQLNMQTETFLGISDLAYQYTKRLSTGTLSADNISLDQGEERNRIHFSNYYRPTFNTYVRFSTGFNLANTARNLSNGTLYEVGWSHLKNRIEPLILEGGYNSADGGFSIFVQDVYDLKEKNQAFITQMNWTYKGQVFGLGFHNFATSQDPNSLYKTYKDRYTFITTLGLRPPNAKWFADFGLDFEVQGSRIIGFNKLARFSYDLHDVRAEFTIRDRNQNLSFGFRINILCGTDPNAKRQPVSDPYWYPWRAPGDQRDF